MIQILTAADHARHEDIFRQMFQGRALIFAERLGWDVIVRDGLEFDRYDAAASPIYVVAVNARGAVVGSLRLLPTIGDTMLRNEFSTLFDDPPDVMQTTTWECTRFCVHAPFVDSARVSAQSVSSKLLIGLCEFALSSGIEHIMGVYEAPMTRVYRRIGWSPVPLARARIEVGRLVVGLWDVSHAALDAMKARGGSDWSGELRCNRANVHKALRHHQDVAALHP